MRGTRLINTNWYFSKTAKGVEKATLKEFLEESIALLTYPGKMVFHGCSDWVEVALPHIWDGLNDPYLYMAKAELWINGELVDKVESRFGCRTCEFDADRGFLLNGKPYPLRGVSRHQDRPEVGNALTKEMHEEDLNLILEMGANTIRLAHYQHAQYFYDLCDEKGLVLWAEIPYITTHMPKGRENLMRKRKRKHLRIRLN